MGWPTYKHFDGLTMHNTFFVGTEPSRKTDGRGSTVIHSVFLGEVECDPHHNESKDWHAVIALPADAHHAVMTPEQAIELGQYLIGLGERVQARREDAALKAAAELGADDRKCMERLAECEAAAAAIRKRLISTRPR